MYTEGSGRVKSAEDGDAGYLPLPSEGKHIEIGPWGKSKLVRKGWRVGTEPAWGCVMLPAHG